jgi:hypothetical protein
VAKTRAFMIKFVLHPTEPARIDFESNLQRFNAILGIITDSAHKKHLDHHLVEER